MTPSLRANLKKAIALHPALGHMLLAGQNHVDMAAAAYDAAPSRTAPPAKQHQHPKPKPAGNPRPQNNPKIPDPILISTYRANNEHVPTTAQALNVDPTTIRRRLKALGLR